MIAESLPLYKLYIAEILINQTNVYHEITCLIPQITRKNYLIFLS